MIHVFAYFEHLENETSVIEDDIARDSFGPAFQFRALLAEWNGQPAGYVIFFGFYSSLQGRAGLFIDVRVYRGRMLMTTHRRSCNLSYQYSSGGMNCTVAVCA